MLSCECIYTLRVQVFFLAGSEFLYVNSLSQFCIYSPNHQPKSYCTCNPLLFHTDSLLFAKMAYIYILTISAILRSQVGLRHNFLGSLPSQILTFQSRDHWFSDSRGYFQSTLYPAQDIQRLKFLFFRSIFLLLPALLQSFDSFLPLFKLQFYFLIFVLVVFITIQ